VTVLKRFCGITTLLACSASLGICDVVSTIFSRPLPIANVNGENGATRSNYAFTESGATDPLQQTLIDGDSFTLPSGTYNSYVITSLSTYSVASLCAGGNPCTANSQAQPLGDEFHNVMLAVRGITSDPNSGAGALIYGNWDILDQGTPDTSFTSPTSNVVGNSNPNITDTNVTYANGQNYEGVGTTPPSYYPLWETTFNNLNLTVQAGVQYQFVVWGFGWYNGDVPCSPNSTGVTIDFQCMDPNTGYGSWYNEYSSPLLSGRFEQGATGHYLSLVNFMNPQLCASPSACDDAPSEPVQPQDAFGNTVDVNENVIIKGYGVGVVATPEPGTRMLVVLGLGLLAFVSRKLRK
jgi:hypothetical protein